MDIKLVKSTNESINSALFIFLLSVSFLEDFKICKNGIILEVKPNLSHLEELLETFLSALYNLTEIQFYFEKLSGNSLILKMYNIENINFYDYILTPYPSNPAEE